ncbi:hypothetical protein [Kribbella swartbergensis]
MGHGVPEQLRANGLRRVPSLDRATTQHLVDTIALECCAGLVGDLQCALVGAADAPVPGAVVQPALECQDVLVTEGEALLDAARKLRAGRCARG